MSIENSDSYMSDHLKNGTPGEQFTYKAELQKTYIENGSVGPGDQIQAENKAMIDGFKLDNNPALNESDLIDASPIKQAHLVGNYIENNDIQFSDVVEADNQSFIHSSGDLEMSDSLTPGEEFIRDVNLTESYLDNGEVTSVDEINAENTAFAEGSTLDYLF